MNKTIKTYNDFLEEKERMTNLLVLQKKKVSDNWTSVKHELLPVSNVFGVIGKMTTRDKSNPLIGMGLKFAGDVLLKNFVFAKAGWLTKLAVPFIVKNYSSHILVDQTKTFFGKIGRIVNKVGSRHSAPSAPTQIKSATHRDDGPVNNNNQTMG